MNRLSGEGHLPRPDRRLTSDGPDSGPVPDLRIGDRVLALSRRTHILGILNVTPDSFYDGGRYPDVPSAVRRAVQMAEQGADGIDIGGESTRPGSRPVPEEEEKSRILPVIRAVAAAVDLPISVDTRRAGVAEAALRNGAHWINDVGGLADDPAMIEVAAAHDAAVIVMHKRGSPESMQKNTDYADLIGEITRFFSETLERAVRAGLSADRLIFDPGIGFGKSAEDCFRLIRRMEAFTALGRPVCVGPSRKSFIGAALGIAEAGRLHGTASAVALASFLGARLVRVHDVAEMAQVVRIADRIRLSE
ncbi:dihydropteroate synthase [bacterium]|nr:dihydropteroate synthase [bacterium]